jgi:integrase
VTWYRAAFNFCQREGIIPPELPNVASSLINDDRRLRRSSKGYKVALTDDELRRLFLGFESAKAAWDGRSRQRADGPPVRHPMGFLLTGFLLFTGCRKGEARGLRVAEIVGHECVLAEHKTDADGKERRIVLGAEAQRVLAEAASWRGRMRYQGPLAFPGPGKNGRSGKLANPADYLRTAMRYGDLVMRLVPHSLRSIYVNYAIRVGVPLDIVQGNVGHANSRSTRKHYIEISAGLLRDGAERVNAGFAALRSSLGWEARPR